MLRDNIADVEVGVGHIVVDNDHDHALRCDVSHVVATTWQVSLWKLRNDEPEGEKRERRLLRQTQKVQALQYKKYLMQDFTSPTAN